MGNSSMTGTYGDWTFVMWIVIFVLAWLSISLVLGVAVGKWLKRSGRPVVRETAPARRREDSAA